MFIAIKDLILTPIVISIFAIMAVRKGMQYYKTSKVIQLKRKWIDHLIQFIFILPYFGNKLKIKINNEANAVLAEIKSEIDAARSLWNPLTTMPYAGLTDATIRKRFENIHSHYRAGRCSSTIYTDYDDELSDLLQFVWKKTALANPFYPHWPLINLLEAEVIAMCQELLHGEPDSPGMISHGGSMATLEACKAYVLQARKNNNLHCEILVPENIHVCFYKAAEILNARLVKIPIDKKTGAADVKQMQKAINKNTCLIVGSAPCFPFGTIDPIAEMAAIAKLYKIPFHIDASLGGFISMFAKEAGFHLPPCDFSLPGVTSIVIGTHKYGQTPNGTSVLLFNKSYSASPTYVCLNWIGGLYASPGIDGTRSGADIATAWAVLCYKGKKEYIKETKKLLELKDQLVHNLNNIDGVSILYPPLFPIIPIKTTNGINPLVVANRLREMDAWSVNILQTKDQKTAGFHICLTPVHANQPEFLNIFTQDLIAAIQYAKNHPEAKLSGFAKIHSKLEEGVPLFVQEELGQRYIEMQTTL